MIVSCHCEGCGKAVKTPFGAFTFALSAQAYKHCAACRESHPDERSRRWLFCSAPCLLKSVRQCEACFGMGEVPDGSCYPEGSKRCSFCEGRGLKLKGKSDA
jgi:hypothetical protein